MQTSDHRKQLVFGLAILVIIAVIVTASLSANSQKTEETSPAAEAVTSSSPVSETTTSPNAPASIQAYKDGTYSATGTYSSPGGSESITVTVTLTNGIISATNSTPKAASSDSREYQAKFINGYKSLIIGKSIDAANLSRVSGSSLTSTGFNNALKSIKSQAKT